MGGDREKILRNISDDLVAGVRDDAARRAILALLRVVEIDAETIRQLKEEVQRLRDENNRLKGEQGKPNIRPKNKNKSRDVSSERERKEKKGNRNRTRVSKKDQVKVDRTEVCELDRNQLPADAEFNGYAEVTVQDLTISTNNVLFRKKIYYSKSENKTYTALVPAGYEGGYGPNIKAMVLMLKSACNMSESKILDFLHNSKIIISAGTVSNMLIKNKEEFHEEKEQIVRAGLEATIYQQIDDTSARVNGENQYTQILCNPYYTAYFTFEHKNRLTILEILRTGKEEEGRGLKYIFNDEAFGILRQLRVAKKIIDELGRFRSEKELCKEEIEQLLSEHFPFLNEIARTRILEATAIASYHQEEDYPVIPILLCDDAPQFKLLTEYLALCWVHEGRHYKKLSPVVPYNVRRLEGFITRYWEYYRKLLGYKRAPSQEQSACLSEEFDRLFSTETGYDALDERIAKTKAKKENMLLVLKYPELPLHNNASELAARQQARKRDVSLHTIVPDGTRANDTFLSIVETCKKLGINCYDYFLDRISRLSLIPPLAEMITAKSTS
jgi:hypothetical protein